MARKIAKNLTITRVRYNTVIVDENKNAQLVEMPDAVFTGVLERLLRARLGKEAVFVILDISSGRFRFEQDVETFVLNATAMAEVAAGGDDDDGDDSDAEDGADDGDEDDGEDSGDPSAESTEIPMG